MIVPHLKLGHRQATNKLIVRSRKVWRCNFLPSRRPELHSPAQQGSLKSSLQSTRLTCSWKKIKRFHQHSPTHILNLRSMFNVRKILWHTMTKTNTIVVVTHKACHCTACHGISPSLDNCMMGSVRDLSKRGETKSDNAQATQLAGHLKTLEAEQLKNHESSIINQQRSGFDVSRCFQVLGIPGPPLQKNWAISDLCKRRCGEPVTLCKAKVMSGVAGMLGGVVAMASSMAQTWQRQLSSFEMGNGQE